MKVFVDASALYALISATDANHQASQGTWLSLARQEGNLVTSNYVLLETLALIGRRLGLQAVRDFQGRLAPLLEAHWVDQDLHDAAVTAMLTTGRRDLSLVDCVSFEVMRRLQIDTAFTFDDHFRQQGFRCTP